MQRATSHPNLALFTSPSCPACDEFTRRFQVEWLRETGDQTTIACRDVLENLDEAVRAGVLRTPALLVDGTLVFQGYLAPAKAVAAVRHALREREEPVS